MTAIYGEQFVRGMQNSTLDPSRLQVSACCKHFTAYDLERWGGEERFSFNAVVSDYDMYTTHLPAFESCFHKTGGAASGMMCSYNAVNGVPMCANGPLMNDRARQLWGFDGYIVSDCGATSGVFYKYKWAPTPREPWPRS